MHIAATTPLVLRRGDISADEAAKQKEIFTAQLKEDPKTAAKEAQWPKMIEGKLNKWYSEVALLEQESVVTKSDDSGKPLPAEKIEKLLREGRQGPRDDGRHRSLRPLRARRGHRPREQGRLRGRGREDGRRLRGRPPMAAPRLCAVSIDLDEVHHYFSIHGLDDGGSARRSAELCPQTPAASGTARHAGYDVALPRLADFAAARGLPLTLFAVGEDLERPANAAALAALAARGHLVENHSQHHRYDLTRLSPAEIAREVDDGAAAIARVTGRRPEGFRAPGYTVTDGLFDALEAAGVAFDSSVFPCPPYYLAKAAAMAGMRLRGRTSRSILDTPRVLAAPRRPYRPGRRWYRRGERPFVELPVQVTPWLGLPFFGTSIGLGGAAVARFLARSCAGEPLVNIELHPMDFLDASDGLAGLVGHQPELRVPVARRIEALGAALDVLQRAGHAFVLLAEAARASRAAA